MNLHNGLYFEHPDDCFVPGDLPDFSPGISRLVYMLDFVRRTTLGAVSGLSTEELDTQVLPCGNTPGMLLAHIAGIEEAYQSVTFEGIRPPLGLPEHELGEAGREQFQGLPLDVYLRKLAEVRSRTLHQLSRRDDLWFDRPYQPWGRGTWTNAFCWFHVVEDEIRHQGQLILMRKELFRRAGAPA